MLSVLGAQDLKATMEKLTRDGQPEDTRLHLDLTGRNPDDAMTDVAYEKGCAMLRTLEAKVGRPVFDAFLRNYFDTYAFQSMTTERFIAHLREHLLEPNNVTFDVETWTEGEGLPADAVMATSDRFDLVEKRRSRGGRWEHQGSRACHERLDDLRVDAFPAPPAAGHERRTDEGPGRRLRVHMPLATRKCWLPGWRSCIRNDHDEAYYAPGSILEHRRATEVSHSTVQRTSSRPKRAD